MYIFYVNDLCKYRNMCLSINKYELHKSIRHFFIDILYMMVGLNSLKGFRTVLLLSSLKRRRKRIEALKKTQSDDHNLLARFEESPFSSSLMDDDDDERKRKLRRIRRKWKKKWKKAKLKYLVQCQNIKQKKKNKRDSQ